MGIVAHTRLVVIAIYEDESDEAPPEMSEPKESECGSEREPETPEERKARLEKIRERAKRARDACFRRKQQKGYAKWASMSEAEQNSYLRAMSAPGSPTGKQVSSAFTRRCDARARARAARARYLRARGARGEGTCSDQHRAVQGGTGWQNSSVARVRLPFLAAARTAAMGMSRSLTSTLRPSSLIAMITELLIASLVTLLR